MLILLFETLTKILEVDLHVHVHAKLKFTKSFKHYRQ